MKFLGNYNCSVSASLIIYFQNIISFAQAVNSWRPNQQLGKCRKMINRKLKWTFGVCISQSIKYQKQFPAHQKNLRPELIHLSVHCSIRKSKAGKRFFSSTLSSRDSPDFSLARKKKTPNEIYVELPGIPLISVSKPSCAGVSHFFLPSASPLSSDEITKDA